MMSNNNTDKQKDGTILNVSDRTTATTAMTRSTRNNPGKAPAPSRRGGQQQQQAQKQKRCQVSRLVMLRLVFVSTLAIAAIVCGYIAFTVIHRLENDVAIGTYESVATSALEGAQAITARKVQGGRVMASILSFAFPDATQWPFIYLDGYAETSSEIAALASSTSLALIVLVQPEEVTTFEQYAEEIYDDNGYSETAGRSEFGFGIYRKDHGIAGQNISCPYSDNKCPDTSGINPWGGENEILAPIYLHNIKNAKSLMFNVYSEQFRTKVLDSMIECADKAKEQNIKPSCGVVTDWVQIIVRPGPASVLYQPIFPNNDPNTMVAWTGTSIHWEEVLMNIVPDYVDGLHCVISADTGTGTHTFVISHGVPQLLGSGDLHDRKFEKYGHTVVLNDIETGASASATYTLTVYPTDLMFSAFQSQSPLAVCFGFVGIILLCTAIFFVYDFVVQNEAHQRKRILEMKRRFVRFISHEIRTPLNIVCMGLDLVQGELRTEIYNKKQEAETEDSKQKADVDSYLLDLTGDILENTNNAVSILNDLLNYDKIESGTFKLELDKVQVWKLIRKTVSEFKIQAKNRKVNLEVVLGGMKKSGVTGNEDEESPPSQDLDALNVFGDDIRLTQVLRNLLSNALKFTPEDGVVSIRAVQDPNGLPDADNYLQVMEPAQQSEEQDLPAEDLIGIKNKQRVSRAGSVLITVKDSGVGLSKDQISQMFTEGLQFDANKLQHGGGSGLGLCISKEIVQQHAGSIEVQSEGRGKGTSFVIELPLYQGLVSAAEKRKEPKEASESTETTTTTGSREGGGKRDCFGRHHHILVVDDVISNSKMLVRLLERAGHTCERATNGQEAIEAFTANQDEHKQNGAKLFGTILMDFEMPVMDGPDATKHLRELGCHAYIFGITGNVLAEDVALFKLCGADHVLPKPVNIAAINACWECLEASNCGTDELDSCHSHSASN